MPGKLRAEPDKQVQVGNHLAPDARVVEPMLALLQQLMGSYTDPRTRLIAALAYHHRLAWAHPVMDGNGGWYDLLPICNWCFWTCGLTCGRCREACPGVRPSTTR